MKPLKEADVKELEKFADTLERAVNPIWKLEHSRRYYWKKIPGNNFLCITVGQEKTRNPNH